MFRKAALAALALSAFATPALAQPDGEQLFAQQCRLCHDDDTMGPGLTGVVGRRIGHGSGFEISEALKTKGGTDEAPVVWNDAELDAFLKGPQAYASGGKMFNAVPDEANRKAIIEYLKTLK